MKLFANEFLKRKLSQREFPIKLQSKHRFKHRIKVSNEQREEKNVQKLMGFSLRRKNIFQFYGKIGVFSDD